VKGGECGGGGGGGGKGGRGGTGEGREGGTCEHADVLEGRLGPRTYRRDFAKHWRVEGERVEEEEGREGKNSKRGREGGGNVRVKRIFISSSTSINFLSTNMKCCFSPPPPPPPPPGIRESFIAE